MPNQYTVRFARPAIHVIGPSIAYIALTRGEFSLVDRDIADSVASFNWFCAISSATCIKYAKRTYLHQGKVRITSIHKHVLPPIGPYGVDHINSNGLDNRRANLRFATHSQNVVNQRVRKTSISGYKGVIWIESTGKWVARIFRDGKNRHLGCFSSAEEASSVYADAALKLHGEFARVDNERTPAPPTAEGDEGNV